MDSLDYILALVISFVAGVAFVFPVIFLAKKLKIIDKPDQIRKIHKKPTPLLGGLAIFLALNLVILLYLFFTDNLTGGTLILKNLLGIFLGSSFLALGGFLDDKYNLAPKHQLVWPIMSIISVIACGIGIDSITNPLGQGLIELDKYSFNLFWYGGFPYKLTLLSDVFTFVWLLAMIYTTKLLDGLDGLVSGITIIAGVFIFLTALNKGEIVQYDVALLAIIMVGVFVGFLVFNFNPAGIFLGEGGSTLAGFLLGTLSIISGSKVGITLMLLGIPLLDFIWTMVRRKMENKKIISADRKHLHHRLLDAGFSVKKSVLFLYFIAVIFGLIAYYFQEIGLNFLSGVFAVIIVFMLILAYIYKKKLERDKDLTKVKK